MEKSLLSLRWRFVILGLFATITVLFLAPTASAGSFTSTFKLGSMNVSDLRVPPNFFTGPFNYGFTALALDPAVTGQVTINSISVSADATLQHYRITDQARSIGRYSLARRPLVLRPAR